MKSNKGFTLIELLVAIVILGIITVMALPAINAFQDQNRLKKYETYEKSMVSAAKLYTDSYNEDLFGYDKEGCAMITYDQLKEKNLLKDIKIDNVSCAGANTYVAVTKKNNKYTYKTKISCIQDGDPSKEVYNHGDATCTSATANTGPTITLTDPSNASSYEADKQVIISINDPDGLYATDIRYQWTEVGSSPSSSAWIDSYVNINSSDKTTASSPITTPPAIGDKNYILYIEPRNVKDVYNNATTVGIQSGQIKVYLACSSTTKSTEKSNTYSSCPSCGSANYTITYNLKDAKTGNACSGTTSETKSCGKPACNKTMYTCRKGNTFLHHTTSTSCGIALNCALTVGHGTKMTVKSTTVNGYYEIISPNYTYMGSTFRYVKTGCLTSDPNAGDCVSSCTG